MISLRCHTHDIIFVSTHISQKPQCSLISQTFIKTNWKSIKNRRRRGIKTCRIIGLFKPWDLLYVNVAAVVIVFLIYVLYIHTCILKMWKKVRRDLVLLSRSGWHHLFLNTCRYFFACVLMLGNNYTNLAFVQPPRFASPVHCYNKQMFNRVYIDKLS